MVPRAARASSSAPEANCAPLPEWMVAASHSFAARHSQHGGLPVGAVVVEAADAHEGARVARVLGKREGRGGVGEVLERDVAATQAHRVLAEPEPHLLPLA